MPIINASVAAGRVFLSAHGDATSFAKSDHTGIANWIAAAAEERVAPITQPDTIDIVAKKLEEEKKRRRASA